MECEVDDLVRQRDRPAPCPYLGEGSPTSHCSTCSKPSLRRRARAGQIALAWMLHKYDFLVPIPGMRSLERIQENLGAADVDLTDDEFDRIEV